MKTIYLIRHADASREDGVKYCLGRRNDWPLSAQGREQASTLAGRFADIPLEVVYVSPLARARQTGEAVAAGRAPVIELPDMIEMDAGEWEGQPIREIKARFRELWQARMEDMSLQPPGGETCEAAFARAMRAAQAVLAALREGGAAAIVAHGSINRTLLCGAAGVPFAKGRQFAQPHAGVAVLRWEDGQLRVLSCEAMES